MNKTVFMITFPFLNQTLWWDPYWNRLSETIPMSGNIIGLGWEIRKLAFWKTLNFGHKLLPWNVKVVPNDIFEFGVERINLLIGYMLQQYPWYQYYDIWEEANNWHVIKNKTFFSDLGKKSIEAVKRSVFHCRHGELHLKLTLRLLFISYKFVKGFSAITFL